LYMMYEMKPSGLPLRPDFSRSTYVCVAFLVFYMLMKNSHRDYLSRKKHSFDVGN